MEEWIMLAFAALGALGFLYVRKDKKLKGLEVEKSLGETKVKSDEKRQEVKRLQKEIDKVEEQKKAGNNDEPEEFWKDFLKDE